MSAGDAAAASTHRNAVVGATPNPEMPGPDELEEAFAQGRTGPSRPTWSAT